MDTKIRESAGLSGHGLDIVMSRRGQGCHTSGTSFADPGCFVESRIDYFNRRIPTQIQPLLQRGTRIYAGHAIAGHGKSPAC